MPIPERDENGQLKKGGPSLNPGGRPKGLASRIRAQTQDGEEILQMFLKVMRGDIPGTTKDKIAAGEWLTDRAFGKAVQTNIQVQSAENNKSTEALKALADAEIESMARNLQRQTPLQLLPVLETGDTDAVFETTSQVVSDTEKVPTP